MYTRAQTHVTVHTTTMKYLKCARTGRGTRIIAHDARDRLDRQKHHAQSLHRRCVHRKLSEPTPGNSSPPSNSTIKNTEPCFNKYFSPTARKLSDEKKRKLKKKEAALNDLSRQQISLTPLKKRTDRTKNKTKR